MNFYACIIGTELLNNRRKDEHFEFVSAELAKRGHEMKASFIIKDEPSFIADIFELIKKDRKSVMFCFGGIGATPDDYTRDIAARVFTDGEMEYQQSVIDILVARLGDKAYPDRVNMAYLPKNAGLLSNPINKIPGFYLEGRFFFMPGFPQMAQPMVVEALDKFYPHGEPKFKKTFTAFCSEGDIVDIMQTLPSSAEFSSLPIMDGDKKATEIYLASSSSCVVEDVYEHFVTLTEKKATNGVTVVILINKLAILLVRFYQKFISPITIGSCRYYPSCSEYAIWQFETNGFIRALFSSILRVLRCNKLFAGGIEYPSVSFSPTHFLKKPQVPKEIKYFFVPQKKGYVAIKILKSKPA